MRSDGAVVLVMWWTVIFYCLSLDNTAKTVLRIKGVNHLSSTTFGMNNSIAHYM